MRATAGLAIVAAALAASGAASAQPAPPPMITVSGEAQIAVAPDQALIDGGVITEARTAREASEANNRAMAALLPALKAAGIAENDIRTSRLSLFPQSTPQKTSGTPQITGYRASNRVTVRIRDIARVAATIDALVAAGANEIGGISFVVSEESRVLNEARGKAIVDAHNKAEIFARAANVRVGAPISISEEGSGGGPAPIRTQFNKGSMPTPIAPGEETLRVSVTVSYELKSAP